ncbi:MAG: hypothetical protein Q9216_000695 [Gyalolechia sp. 2 TL-2023]
MADVANQGMSSILNEDKLGNDPSWTDHARDLLYVINMLREKMPRPLVGIGHSMGGNILTNLALMHPRLLSPGLILIDPVLEIPSARPSNTAATWLTQLSTFRRDYWPSREEAVKSFRGSSFYKTWDDRVLNRWLDIGLRDTPTALYPHPQGDAQSRPVTLLTTKHQEVFTFLRPNFDGLDRDGCLIVNQLTHPDLDLESGETYPFYRPEPASTFKRLPYLRPSVLYVHGGKSDLSAPELREQRMSTTGIGVGGSGGAAAGRVKQVMFKDAGHLMPMEIVGELADAAAEWLVKEMRCWRQQEEKFQNQWGRTAKPEKQTVSEEWKRRIGGDPRGTSNKSQL